jgi:hypothetical protein
MDVAANKAAQYISEQMESPSVSKPSERRDRHMQDEAMGSADTFSLFGMFDGVVSVLRDLDIVDGGPNSHRARKPPLYGTHMQDLLLHEERCAHAYINPKLGTTRTNNTTYFCIMPVK